MSTVLDTDVEIVTQLVTPVPATSPRTPEVVHVVGCRSEAVRLAPVLAALKARDVVQAVARVVGPGHVAGQAIDSGGLPRTERLVAPLLGTRVHRTANALAAAEAMLSAGPPELVLVAGDTATSLAFALAAAKLGVKVVRVGGGLRCGDVSIGEEINRILADRLADVIFTDGPEATRALAAEGIAGNRVRQVGSTTVDLIRRWAPAAAKRTPWTGVGVRPQDYVLVTLHRPENLEADERVARITEAIARLAERVQVVLPLHPSTRAALAPMGDLKRLESAGVHIVEPLGYLDFLALQLAAGAIVTDSGGVQEESSALGVRCYTLRRATERISTLLHGTNILLGDAPEELTAVRLGGPERHVPDVPGWDGRAAKRIADQLVELLGPSTTSEEER